MLDFFKNRKKQLKDFQGVVRSRQVEEKEIDVPDGLFEVCPKCDVHLLREDLAIGSFVCSACQHHFRMTASARLASLIDTGRFEEMDADLVSFDPLEMPGYSEKLAQLQARGLKEAVRCGIGDISGFTYAIAVMDSHFLMGSMGTVVGEKLVNLIERATDERLPLLIFATSGGARMQEGILSLMQMAKTTAAIKKHQDAGLLYICVLTSPTYGGVSASFATVADIIIAEPEALIGFAGPRVIKQTIKQVLPKGFQSAEFLLEKGFVDMIVPRVELVKTIRRLSKMHRVGGSK
ncbi:MAG: acetyl-CoA carboxylase, carboxyltransferase subunit beta [Defluviitaleaceae bacterium]|nr:acetyl-CoA carboxylase, carboxyltransferase subunit beta [Defluviitaleaceae bacterium]